MSISNTTYNFIETDFKNNITRTCHPAQIGKVAISGKIHNMKITDIVQIDTKKEWDGNITITTEFIGFVYFEDRMEKVVAYIPSNLEETYTNILGWFSPNDACCPR